MHLHRLSFWDWKVGTARKKCNHTYEDFGLDISVKRTWKKKIGGTSKVEYGQKQQWMQEGISSGSMEGDTKALFTPNSFKQFLKMI